MPKNWGLGTYSQQNNCGLYTHPSLLDEGRLLEAVLKAERGRRPAGVARNHALGRLRGPARACTIAGANADDGSAGPETENPPGGAPRGAPASVIGR